jgi:hypothetical protein
MIQKSLLLCLVLLLSGCVESDFPNRQYKNVMEDATAECATRGGVRALWSNNGYASRVTYKAYCMDGNTTITKTIDWQKY